MLAIGGTVYLVAGLRLLDALRARYRLWGRTLRALLYTGKLRNFAPPYRVMQKADCASAAKDRNLNDSQNTLAALKNLPPVMERLGPGSLN